MTDLDRLSDTELVELVERMRSPDLTWEMSEVAGLADQFRWEIQLSRPTSVLLDSGFGVGSATVRAHEGRIVRIVTRVTEYVEDDRDGRAASRDAFVAMVRTLEGVMGEPTALIPGSPAMVRWAGPVATVVLRDQEVAVELELVDSARLARDDQIWAAEQESP